MGNLNDTNIGNPMAVQVMQSPGLMISRGQVDGQEISYKFGHNSDVGTTEEVICDNGGVYAFPVAATKLDIVSTKIEDENPGAGAWSVKIYGQDDTNAEISETVLLTGTVIATTTKDYFRVHRMVVLTGGTDAVKTAGGGNTGVITAKKTGSTEIYAQIQAGEGQTLMCVYTVPADKTLYIFGMSFDCARRDDVIVRYKYRNDGTNGVLSTKRLHGLYEMALTENFFVPFSVPEKTDMVMTAQTTVGSCPVSGTWEGVLVDNV
ncbi:MAG: hypothetical protein GY832_31055 [Chloroflexi bacterium]|nr:hypothetical protein [Chloroflexota bacterium]